MKRIIKTFFLGAATLLVALLLFAILCGESTATLDLETSYVGNTEVHLSWNEFTGGDTFNRTEVHRNGTLIETLDDDEVITFKADELEKNDVYRFRVTRYYDDGDETKVYDQEETADITIGEVHGTLLFNAFWRESDSPYHLTGDVEPAEDVNLTLGIWVEITGGYRVTVTGSLVEDVNITGGLRFENMDYLSVRKVRFDGREGRGPGLHLDSCNDTIISECHFSNFDEGEDAPAIQSGRWYSEPSFCPNLQIEESTFLDNGYVICRVNTLNSIITGNVFTNNSEDIQLEGDNNRIIDNSFIRSTSGGGSKTISVKGDHNIITGNDMNGDHPTGSSRAIMSGGNGTTISGNNITNYGYGFSNAYMPRTTNHTIKNNRIEGSHYQGILLYGYDDDFKEAPSDHNTIWKNIIINGKDGIVLRNANHNIFEDNNISQNSGTGIRIFDSSGGFGNTFRDNTVSFNAGFGIFIENTVVGGDVGNNVVQGNRIHNNSKHGLIFSTTNNNTVLNNNISDNEGKGIVIDRGCSNNSITGNTVLEAGRDGILLEGHTIYPFGENKVNNNRITIKDHENYYEIKFERESESATNQFRENTIGKTNPVKVSITDFNNSFGLRGVETKPGLPGPPDHNSRYRDVSCFVEMSCDVVVDLTFHYSDDQLGGLDEGRLWIWKKNDSGWEQDKDTNKWATRQEVNEGTNEVLVNITDCGESAIFAPLLPDSPVCNSNTGKCYDTIQEAIDAPDTMDGHTISVDVSYTTKQIKENIVVNKKIIIESASGNSEENIVQVKNGGDNTILITANATIQGFTIQGAIGDSKAGVHLQGSGADGSTITNNIITGNHYGVHIDGTSNCHVESNRILANTGGGIRVQSGANGNTIGGRDAGQRNIISGNGVAGIALFDTSTKSNWVLGNYIGTDETGTVAYPNRIGIYLWKTTANQIGFTNAGNVISGNREYGIWINHATHNFVYSNYIGTDSQGSSAIPNELSGIRLYNYASSNYIGSQYEGHRNIISGNKKSGISINGSANNNDIIGNFIGAGVDGSTALPNQEFGVLMYEQVSKNTLKSNCISGNRLDGVRITGSGYERPFGNKLVKNFIGTNRDGTKALPNEGYGVAIPGGAHDNYVGGVEGNGNTISGNLKSGVFIGGKVGPDRNDVFCNFIGTNFDGTVAIPNQENGIEITGNAVRAYLGGGLRSDKTITEGTGNIISGNRKNGIWVHDCEQKNYIINNLIGTRPDGTTPLPNGENGILAENTMRLNIGTLYGGGNVISGNEKNGILLTGKRTIVVGVFANYIGTTKDGLSALPNEENGIEIAGKANQNDLGGHKGKYTGRESARNVISGNRKSGILIRGENTGGNSIMYNIIGLNRHANAKIPNGRYGIELGERAVENFIGDYYTGRLADVHPSEDQANVIAGNKLGGILLEQTHDNQIYQNHIGTNWDGDPGLGNTGYGVYLSKKAIHNEVALNRIWYNDGGIGDHGEYGHGRDNRVLQNDIRYNKGNTGIHLDNSSSSIIGNTITGDEGNGIVCENGSQPLLRYNNIHDNAGYDLANTDPSVTIDARYNWWGSPDGAGAGIDGPVDSSVKLAAEMPGGDMESMNGTNSSSLFNGTLFLEYTVGANTSLSFLEFPESPFGSLDGCVGRFFMLMANDTTNITSFVLSMNYTSGEIEGKDEASITPHWWDGSGWQACSEWVLDTVDSGNFSGHVRVTIDTGTSPALSDLSEILLGLAAEEEGTGPVEHTITMSDPTITGTIEPGKEIMVSSTVTVEPVAAVESVKVFLDGTEMATATPNGQQYEATITLPEDLAEGDHTITVNATLETGEFKERSAIINYKKTPTGEEDDDDDDEEGTGVGVIIAVLVVVVLLVLVLLKMGMIPVEGMGKKAVGSNASEDEVKAPALTPEEPTKESPRYLSETQEADENEVEAGKTKEGVSEETGVEGKETAEEAVDEGSDDTGEQSEEKKEEEKGSDIT